MQRESTFKIIDRGWLNVNKIFMDYYKECPTFINSLYFDWQKKVLGVEYTYNTKDKWYAVNYVSISIFQSWEDFITSSNIDQTGDVVWLNNFLQWTHSPILNNNWEVLKTNYTETTQVFGDYLFYMSKKHNITNEYELNELAKEIANSDKFKGILHKRFDF
jgi:hypothetical protein